LTLGVQEFRVGADLFATLTLFVIIGNGRGYFLFDFLLAFEINGGRKDHVYDFVDFGVLKRL
jgi:hypothetical protein